MSSEQANAFKKHRDADDAQGNLTWAARLQSKALRAAPEALARLDVERDFELSEDERVLWRLLRLPRKYMDIEHSGLLATAQLRGVLRGLVAADVLDIVDAAEAKALIPAELRRLRAEVQGKEAQRSAQPLKARVYRPDISGKPPEPPPEVAPPPELVDTPREPTAPRRAPQPVQLRELNADERALKTEVERAHAAMAKQNHYEFLGLQRGADDAAVRSAYVRLARDFHPDRFAGFGDPALQAKVDELFKRLGDSQQALATGEGRAHYDRALDSMGGATTTADGQRQRRPLEAQNAFRIADVYLKKKEYKSAEAHFRQAANFDPEDPKILTALAWCIWLNPDHEEAVRTGEAKKRLQEVINKHRLGDASYKMGLILRKNNDESAAQRAFAQARRHDPDHHDAEREVRLQEQRAQKQAKPEGLLGRFAKK